MSAFRCHHPVRARPATNSSGVAMPMFHVKPAGNDSPERVVVREGNPRPAAGGERGAVRGVQRDPANYEAVLHGEGRMFHVKQRTSAEVARSAAPSPVSGCGYAGPSLRGRRVWGATGS